MHAVLSHHPLRRHRWHVVAVGWTEPLGVDPHSVVTFICNRDGCHVNRKRRYVGYLTLAAARLIRRP